MIKNKHHISVSIWSVIVLACLNQAAAADFITGPGFAVTPSMVEAELAGGPAASASAPLPAGLINEAINAVYRRQAVAAAARAAQLDAQPEARALMARAADEALVKYALDQKRAELMRQIPDMTARARELYQANPAQFRVSEQRRVSHILLRADSPEQAQDRRAEAEAILERLKQGEDFAELAKEVSEDTGSAERGGDVGSIRPGAMVPEFEAAAMALEQAGDLSPVVETAFGLHIIKLDDLTPAEQKSFEDIKDNFTARLGQQWVQKGVEAWRLELVDPTKAEVNEAAVEAFVEQMTSAPAADANTQ